MSHIARLQSNHKRKRNLNSRMYHLRILNIIKNTAMCFFNLRFGNALPFGDKKYLRQIVNNIYNHMSKGGIFALTLFSNKHTFVKNKKCYGVTNKYINELFKNYTILWCEKMEFDMQPKSGIVNWSSYDIIVIKI